ncbi:aspartyl-tRNA synthetase, promiscuous (also recognizes tRNAasn) [Oenococcus oeni]|uniref:aspartate--tRNA ligase n=1 Tax=Oenococcus oeni TaxID=1247 RepID=UPI00107B67BF|nr:aspartate--tRNA ligase [Oenococcus oeni]AVI93799.1 aspartate--tRNA ligase [Oenococcus oeni]SYW01845.1 aspartyl-tRNA synthetase, promiscuous (also recognizes tRNAasn) [Oenococcus oeni]SYW04676.1 aspartyl-tRNA synthetase, promiscuous (also recognizes tRNAasn) [Oenococcus oeni]SYW18246.1 aspartyl-tRNA synthetase, promiscuous (also recognizes tRNAasn) [Oenococcus oeni]VDC14262.1 aspartyl-tRNA synthetase, promiscuous (also recognizes tRNAasn) [Oenococcus oeni]
MSGKQRTVYAGLVNEKMAGQTITLKGWVQKRRDLGGLIFVDLRDREGIVQLTFSDEFSKDALKTAERIRSEYVISITGVVSLRAESAINPKMKTGKIEVLVHQAEILAESKTPPFDIEDGVDVNEELKLKYRYLDLRRPEMQKGLILRSKIMSSSMRFMEENGFLDIETPYLAKSTPEGARDYLVPSRIYPGSFYALPQSPQLFKQLLMGAGFDRYFQIARCFRDEDLRGDRQPEFTQLDMETSFMNQGEIMELVNRWITQIMSDVVKANIDSNSFPVLHWQEAMDRFGSDKPDLRFGIELHDVSEIMKQTNFTVFTGAIKKGGFVKAIVAPKGATKFTRKMIDGQTDYIKRFGAKGLAWIKFENGEFSGPIAKFVSDVKDQLVSFLSLSDGDLVFFAADTFSVVSDTLGYLRKYVAKELDLIDESKWDFAWIVDWPLFEYSEDFGRWIAAHHPFTMPNEEDLHYLDDGEDPHLAHAQSYDLVLNGYELGSGSIRIHTMDIQKKMLKALGFTSDQAEKAFGFLLEAMEYGFPPMGGIALGLDRLAMLLSGKENIREVIAFPKNSNATEPMTKAPSRVSEKQLTELGLRVPE